jgi:hypothetical protein
MSCRPLDGDREILHPYVAREGLQFGPILLVGPTGPLVQAPTMEMSGLGHRVAPPPYDRPMRECGHPP